MKGLNQEGSLGIDGVVRMVLEIRNLELSFGVYHIFICKQHQETQLKLERSLAINKFKHKGSTKYSWRTFTCFLPVMDSSGKDKDKVVGKILSVEIQKDQIIYPQYLSND